MSKKNDFTSIVNKVDEQDKIFTDLFAEAKTLYHGFYINKEAGNNAFSFALRKDPSIFVAALEEGVIESIGVGKNVAFEDYDGFDLKSCVGLNKFIFTRCLNESAEVPEVPGVPGVPGAPEAPEATGAAFIFDNHNHAFFFWFLMKRAGYLSKKTVCFHIDAHKDTRHPTLRFEDFCEEKDLSVDDLKAAFFYTNEVLNVGSFIKPAQDIGIIDELFIVDGEASMKEAFERLEDCEACDVILDLDLDFFVSELDFLDNEKKISLIKAILKRACVVTVASSPFFMDQNYALQWLKRIFIGCNE